MNACAHCKVVLKHIDHPNGTRSDYWECAYGCGCKFWPESHFTDLRTRAEKAERSLQHSHEANQAWLKEFDALKSRAEKAEAEVVTLQWDLNICSNCGGEIFHHIDEPFYDCQKCGQHGEATVIPKLQKARYDRQSSNRL